MVNICKSESESEGKWMREGEREEGKEETKRRAQKKV